MNDSFSTPSQSIGINPMQPARRKSGAWIYSLTGVCFLFGGLLAAQLRAFEQVQTNRRTAVQTQADQRKQMQEMQVKFAKETRDRAALQTKLKTITVNLATGTQVSRKQLALLNSQIKELQVVAGLTPVSGPGIEIELSDNANAAQGDAGASAFLPGIVHDFDLQQVVNELRAAKADAISISGAAGAPIRITGYTPIRCVGPVIYINWEPVAAPFHVEAAGNPRTLMSALNMPGGIVSNLKNNTLGVKLTERSSLTLPATEGVPRLRVASRS